MGRDPLTVLDVLRGIHGFPKRLQSNYVRDNSQIVARLASTGLITTAVTTAEGDTYGMFWRVTFKGLRVLELAGDDE